MSRDDSDGLDYDDSHRTLLQLFISRHFLTLEDAQALLASIIADRHEDRQREPDNVATEQLESYIHAINNRISPYDLEIRSTRHQRTNERVYTLVNTTSDSLMQMATTHTVDEVAFVRRVLDAMFETYNSLRAEVMAITSMQALKLAKPTSEEAERRASGPGGGGPVAAITGVQAENTLKDMVAEGWFEQTRANGTQFYTLTPRALLELREWLADTYNMDVDEDADAEEIATATKVKKCAACQEIVTTGQRCPRQTCLGRLHGHCTEKMFRARGNRTVCPVCDMPWIAYLPVGIKAAGSAPRTNEAASNRGRSIRSETYDNDDDDDNNNNG